MVERGLEPDFPQAALKELTAITAPAGGGEGIRDLRELLWASIDNDDSRDLDQLTVAEALDGGRVRILVAVADVDALVQKGSALDGHAACNTTSIYTPGAMFPMLPLGLSTNLTSLNEGQERVAMVVDMVFEADGALTGSDVYRGLVRNRAKLAYNAVGAWLAGEGAVPQRVQETPGLDANLRLQDAVAQRLAGMRHEHGALSLETIQPQASFDGDTLSDLDQDQKNRATQLIEDFMIAANGVIALYLKAKGCPSLRRVLKSPERWQRIVSLAAGFGDRLPDAPDALALEGFLTRRRAAGRAAGALRAGGAGLHALDRAEPALPGPDYATAAQGGPGGWEAALYGEGADRAGGALYGAGGCSQQGGTPGAQVCGGAAASPPGGGKIRCDRYGRVAEGDVGQVVSTTHRGTAGAGVRRAGGGEPGACEVDPYGL